MPAITYEIMPYIWFASTTYKCKSRVDQSLGIGKTVEYWLLIYFLFACESRLETVHKHCTAIDNTVVLKFLALCKIEPRGNGWLSGVWGLIDHVDSSSVGG